MNSRDKQQGDPEICRESVTIPMVQSVYGSQPQIRAGIGPTEHVRQMSEQELRRETLFEIRREIAGGLLPREEESLPNESKRALFYIDRELKKVSDYVRQQSVPDATGLTELVKWLQSEAEKRIKLAELRKDSAEAMRGATADELRDAKRTAEKMSGRKLDLASTTVEAAQKSAEIDEKIAAKYVAESSQLSQWAAELVRQAKRETALLELAIEMGHEYGRTGTFRPGSPNGLPTPDDVRKRFIEVKGGDAL